MSLDPAYLEYPRRRLGYDHDLYAWSALHQRPPVAWPGGAALAVWIVVSLEWFPMTPVRHAVPRARAHGRPPIPTIAIIPRGNTARGSAS